MKTFFTGRRIISLTLGLLLVLLYIFSLPSDLFQDPYSTVLEDRSGQLLAASIAHDGQWRFPASGKVNEKFEKALIVYEDKRFRFHPGVDLLAVGRAFRQNIAKGKIVSGGSTLTMQLIRLARKNPPRNLFQKVFEAILATRAELRYSKDEIVNLYAAHAPFGGNVVGVDAACWRYLGRNSDDLSWAEAALLAVLPNNPSLIHLARNREQLRQKRDGLLLRLYDQEMMDTVSYNLALAEPIPDKPQSIPQLAPHLLDRCKQEGHSEQIVHSTVDAPMQQRVQQFVDDYFQRLKGNQVFNAAALVLDVNTGEALAYIGNTRSGAEHQEQVDVVRSPRSTGSILKPFLYAAMLDEGKMLPTTLIPDVPTLIGGFAPKNFSRQYDGAVPADQAMIRSLNIPVVYELKDFRYEKFYNLLNELGMTTLSKPADHYGLSLVLGGAEGSLWDITGMYASCARTLNNYFEHPGKNKYSAVNFHAPSYIETKSAAANLGESSPLSAASLWITFEKLTELYRPGEETGWQHFSSSKTIAWKTGTSFGLRDAWAVGVNASYAVGVWVGNADGEGRPGLTGTEAAAPLLFGIFSSLPGNAWFQKPGSELSDIAVCSVSGQRASEHCTTVDTVSVPLAGLQSGACQYHKLIHLSNDGRYRVHSECESTTRMRAVSWFVLPPIQEYYFKGKNMSYRTVPPYRSDCADPLSVASVDLIYPKVNSKIYLPVQLDGSKGSTVFEATHRRPTAMIYWHLDGQFIGTTRATHRVEFAPEKGRHVLTLVDESGETIRRSFDVISAR
jgi:penicillin-binding protein 1C